MTVTVGLIQDHPIFFDKEKTLQKMEALITTYAGKGCELLVFPESFLPGYPRGFDFGATVGSRTKAGKKVYQEYHRNSIGLEGEEMKRLIALSKQQKCYLVIGFTERWENNGSLYCSMAYISPTDGLLGVHRKIKPTGSERVIWAEASGESLVTFETKIGRLGGLICWENYMPLARMSMYQKGVQIYIAPTADSRENWTATMQHIALEGRCFVLGCNQYFTKTMYPEKYQALLHEATDAICPGGSLIVAPSGELIAGPLFGQPGVLMAVLDLETIIPQKMEFDVNGHYTRNDIFEFQVKQQPETKKEKHLRK
ncbi:MAG: carbon-nitrogen hydrolase family protein [Bacteroidota bacterium]